MSDVAFDLSGLLEPTALTHTSQAQTSGQGKKWKRLNWILTATAVLVLLAVLPLAIAYLRHTPADTRVMKFSVLQPLGSFENTELGSTMAVSPDGRWLAFTAATGGKDQLWVRALDALTPQVLPGTEGAHLPFWSPDNHFIGFFASGKLKKIEVSGGAAQTLCDAPDAWGGTWNRDGVIVFASYPFGLSRVSATGGEVTAVTTIDSARQETSNSFPSFLPDGRHFFYCMESPNKETRGIYLGSLNGRVKQRLLSPISKAVYAASNQGAGGYLLFVEEGVLLARPFDAQQLKLIGESYAVAARVGSWHFCVSDNGVLVYDPGLLNRQLVWVDRQGKQIRSLGEGGYTKPQLSPDEKRVVVDRLGSQPNTADLWLYDVAGGDALPFTFDPGIDAGPVWSPDGSRIVWSSDRQGTFSLHWKAASGAGQDEPLPKPIKGWPFDWSLDGRFIVYGLIDPETSRDVWVLPLFGDQKPFPFLRTEATETGAQLSPDGRWMAYASNESGGYEVFVQSFPAGGGKKRVSTQGGWGPHWRRDGKELFYYATDGKLMAVEVKSGASFAAGVPSALFEFVSAAANFSTPYTVTADGQRFLLNTRGDESVGAPLTVVINWAAKLRN